MSEMFGFSLQRDRLYTQVADQIEQLIASESLRPGDKLPGERDMAERMGVSRTVVREAIRVLGVRGLVQVKTGCGTFVQEPSAKNAAASIGRLLKLRQGDTSFEHIHEVRSMIELETAGLAAERATDEDLAYLARTIEGMAAHKQDLDAYIKYDHAFHEGLAEATHNSLFNVLLSPISDLLHRVILVSVQAPGALNAGLAHHRNILAQVRQHAPRAARQAMRDHLSEAKKLVQTAQDHTQGQESAQKRMEA
jgi:GntR family transcriptional repressor for pyruvate dehydrogenase complex